LLILNLSRLNSSLLCFIWRRLALHFYVLLIVKWLTLDAIAFISVLRFVQLLLRTSWSSPVFIILIILIHSECVLMWKWCWWFKSASSFLHWVEFQYLIILLHVFLGFVFVEARQLLGVNGAATSWVNDHEVVDADDTDVVFVVAEKYTLRLESWIHFDDFIEFDLISSLHQIIHHVALPPGLKCQIAWHPWFFAILDMLHFHFLKLVMIVNKIRGVAPYGLLFMYLRQHLNISKAIISFETLYILLKENANHIR
jgi:hypothetical protein